MKMKLCKSLISLCAAICLLLLCACAASGEAETKQAAPAALEAVQAVDAAQIESIAYTRYTEGGALSGSVTNAETIQEIFRRLSVIALGAESQVWTSDDGLYLTVAAGGEEFSLYFEGGNLVIGSKQYTAENLGPLKRCIDQLLSSEAEETNAPAAQDSPYRYWTYYNGYAYSNGNGQLRYWIEFRDEFYLHCLFRSGEPGYYEQVYTLYPDWEASPAQQLTICTVEDANGNDLSDRFESLDFLFSSEDVVLMQVKRNEQTLAGGEDENLLTGEYTLKPREAKTPEQLCVLAREHYGESCGFYPPEAELMDNGDGTYTIHLFEIVDLGEGQTHTATSAWYTVDAYGVGIDEITGKTVELTH
ncbi:MAG: hypothetical protein ACI3XG_06265 [Faecousia sp.]